MEGQGGGLKMEVKGRIYGTDGDAYGGPSKMPRNGKLSFFLKLADSMWRPRNEMIDKLRGSISESCPD